MGGLFIIAAVTKLAFVDRSIETLWLPWGAGTRTKKIVLLCVAFIEVAVGFLVTFAPPGYAFLSLAVIWISFASLSWYGSQAIRHSGSCGCFGPFRQSGESDSRLTILRNLTLGCLATVGVLASAGSSHVISVPGALIGVAMPWLLTGLASGFLHALAYFDAGKTILRRIRILLGNRRAIV